MTINFTVEGFCACCLSCAPTTYDCRTRGGTAELRGLSEYTSPSTPPLKYLKQSIAGEWRTCNYNGTVCGGSNQDKDRNVYSGSYDYNAATGVGTNSQVNNYYALTAASACDNTMPLVSSGVPAEAFTPNYTMNAVFAASQTVKSWDYNVACFRIGTTSFSRLQSGIVTAELSLPDTEANAITRLLAGAGGTWSAWTPTGDGTGGTCLPPSCCLARWEERLADFDFIYQEAEWRVQRTGLTPSTSYTIKVELWRRPFGVGSFAYYGDQYFSGMSDGSGNLDLDGEISNEEGFETYAASVELCEAAS